MLGFFGLMAVLLALISLCSYWISWDLQHKDYRPSFATRALGDIVDLVRKCRGVLRNRELWRGAAPNAYANRESAMRINSTLQRSEHS
jgi:hypothetical protein